MVKVRQRPCVRRRSRCGGSVNGSRRITGPRSHCKANGDRLELIAFINGGRPNRIAARLGLTVGLHLTVESVRPSRRENTEQTEKHGTDGNNPERKFPSVPCFSVCSLLSLPSVDIFVGARRFGAYLRIIGT